MTTTTIPAQRPSRRSEGPPGPGRQLPGALLLAFRRDPLQLLTSLHDEYGDVVRVRLLGQDVYLLCHPDAVREVLETPYGRFHKGRGLERARRLLGDGLLTSEDQLHQRQRRLVQPAFHRARLTGYGEVMTRHAEDLGRAWQPGEAVDMNLEMMRLTRRIVAKTLFDYDIRDRTDEIDAAMATLVGGANIGSLLMAWPWTERLPFSPAGRLRRATEQLDDLIYRMIAERRASGRDHGDLLSMLLIAQDEAGDGATMSDQQVRDEALTLFLAGHETTANALSWTWFLLASHPEVAERLHVELDGVLGGRAPTTDDLSALVYTRQVLSESMRLYPPAWTIGRRALLPHQVGAWTIPAGALVLMPQWVLQRDARWFPDPTRFDPDRWLPDQAAQRPRYSYFPFGGGLRRCVGEAFAWMEGTLLLAALAQDWAPRLQPGAAPEPLPRITLRPKGGLPMVLERRERAHKAG